MSFSTPRWWQWWVAAVAIGAAVGVLRRLHNGDLSSWGAGLNSRSAFEQALTSQVGGRPLFCDLTVYACRIPDGQGGTRPVHVVRGLYCDDEPDPRDHKLHWRPTFFLAPVPYPADADDPARTAPTVLDLLDSLRRTADVHYTNAWWDSYPLATSLGGSALLIGLMCPMLINLVTCGRLVAPRRSAGPSLWRVRPARAPRPAAPIKAQLPVTGNSRQGADGVEEQPTPAPAAAPSTPAPVLRTEPVPAAPVAEREEAVFGATGEDYYPTAVHAPRSGCTP